MPKSKLDEILATFRGTEEVIPEYKIAGEIQKLFPEVAADQRDECWSELVAFKLSPSTDKKSIWGTTFGPWATLIREDDTEEHRPSKEEITPDVLGYWKKRLEEEKHPILKARYAHLLWDLNKVFGGLKPEIAHLESAVDSYMKAASFAASYKDAIFVSGWLELALDLCNRANRKDLVHRVIDKYFEVYPQVMSTSHDGTWPFLFDDLYGLRELSEERSKYIISSLEEILSYCVSNSNPWGAQTAAERLAKHYSKMKDSNSVQRVCGVAARSFEVIATQGDPMVGMGWLESALELYEKSSNTQEAKRVRVRISELAEKANDNMGQISTSVRLDKNELYNFFDAVSGETIDQGLTLLAVKFCTSVEEVQKDIQRMKKETPLLSLLTQQLFSDGRVVASISSGDEQGKLFHQIAQKNGFDAFLLRGAIAHTIEKHDLDAKKILTYLMQSPVFDLKRKSILQIAIEDYLNRDFLHAVHLFVPQIEHLIRRLLAHIGEPTVAKTNGRYTGSFEEITLGAIFHDINFQEIYGPDATTYLQSLLTEKRGDNLRNRVAHGLILPESFNSYTADRLFHAILLIAILPPDPAES